MPSYSIDRSGGTERSGFGQQGSQRPGSYSNTQIDRGGGHEPVGMTRSFGGLTGTRGGAGGALGKALSAGKGQRTGGGFLVVAGTTYMQTVRQQKLANQGYADRIIQNRRPNITAPKTPVIGQLPPPGKTGGRLPPGFVDPGMLDRPGQFGPTSPQMREDARTRFGGNPPVPAPRPNQPPSGRTAGSGSNRQAAVFQTAKAINKTWNQGLKNLAAGKKLSAKQQIVLGTAFNKATQTSQGRAEVRYALFGASSAGNATAKQKVAAKQLVRAAQVAKMVQDGRRVVTKTAAGKTVIRKQPTRRR